MCLDPARWGLARGAVGLDLLAAALATAVAAGLTWGPFLLPWAGWLVSAGTRNQVSLLALNEQGFGDRIAALAIFYLQRLPDQLTGPLVEIGTVFQHRTWIAAAVNIWATVATGVVALGLVLTLRLQRRRLAGLTAFATLAVLLVWPFTEAGRFLIPLVPCLLVGAVDGVASFTARCKLRRVSDLGGRGCPRGSLPYATYAIVFARAKAQRQTYRDFDAACTG